MNPQILLKSLINKGILTQEAADKAAKESSIVNKDIETIILDRRLANDVDVAKAKSELLRIPYKKITPEEVNKEILNFIPVETARTYKIIPLSKNGNMLVVGMLNPDDAKAQEVLKFVAKQSKINLGVFLVSASDLEVAMRKYSPFKDQIDAAIKSLDIKIDKNNGPKGHFVQLEDGPTQGEEAPIIKIVASMLKEAINLGASDIHIEPERSRLRVRFRVDGELQEVNDMPVELHQPIISRVKVLANLKIDENRVPQDGRFRSIVYGRDIDFRIATFPTPAGEKVAIRVLDPTVGLKSLNDLGLKGHNLEIVQDGIQRPFGLVLITGPTGSGKTTTLYALMQILNKVDVNIVSLEDPVEYFIDGLNQSQVRPEIGYDFAAGLRQILRQDPDVIMVGEIRDNETASLAVHASLTGHIVLSTLHTNNSIGVIPRLIDMKVEPFLIPSAVNLMVSQRLVVQLCPNCKKAESASEKISDIIKGEIDKLAPSIKSELKISEPYKIFHAPGCNVCKNKGILGRIAIFEVLKMTPGLQGVVSSGPTEIKIMDEAKKQGMVTLRQDGILKALEGLVSIEEVLKETEEI